MRRSLAVLAGSGVVVAGLLTYKSGPTPRALRAARVPVALGGSASTTTTAVTIPRESATSRQSTTTTAPARRVVTGEDVVTRFGDVQVQAVVVGTKLIDVVAIQLPFEKRRSQAISDQAAPILRQEALAAQGAAIHLVSGATYTSEGYSRSLQAAIDAARR